MRIDHRSVMSLQSRISGESIAGQCPAIMPQHSHPYVGRVILDGRYTSTHGGQIPTMAGLGTKEKAPQGACTASTMFPYGAYSEEDLVEGSFKVRVGDAGNAGNHHSTEGGLSLSSTIGSTGGLVTELRHLTNGDTRRKMEAMAHNAQNEKLRAEIDRRLELMASVGQRISGTMKGWSPIPMIHRDRLQVGPTIMREFRACAAISGIKAARLCGFSKNAWYSYEAGRAKITEEVKDRVGQLIRHYMIEGKLLSKEWGPTEKAKQAARIEARRMEDIKRRQDQLAIEEKKAVDAMALAWPPARPKVVALPDPPLEFADHMEFDPHIPPRPFTLHYGYTIAALLVGIVMGHLLPLVQL